MSKVIIPTEKWVGLYAEISNYVLEYSSLDSIYMEDENGDVVFTPEKQNQFNDITDSIENILSVYLTKGEI